jgi:hypothetical protein
MQNLHGFAGEYICGRTETLRKRQALVFPGIARPILIMTVFTLPQPVRRKWEDCSWNFTRTIQFRVRGFLITLPDSVPGNSGKRFLLVINIFPRPLTHQIGRLKFPGTHVSLTFASGHPN